MGFLTGKAKTYSWDLPLFKKLGLKEFEIDDREKTFVGDYKIPHMEKAIVKIWVTCYPAMFWEFKVVTEYGKVFYVKTGSGSLTNFWDSIEKIATDMIVLSKEPLED